MPERKKKKREVVDEINERYGRIQLDLKFIYHSMKSLSLEAQRQFRHELRLNLSNMIKEMFGEGG